MVEQLVVVVPVERAELVACELFDLGARAVEERAHPDGVELVAGFAPEVDLHELVTRLGDPAAAAVRTVADDGLDTWRRFATPTSVGRLRIVPAWCRDDLAPAGADTIDVVIEPGRAFGIGDHPATRLALDAVLAHVDPGAAVLDVGTGSGVLAIAAARLGATSVLAVDIDAHALDVARANVAANSVDDVVTVAATPLAAVVGPFDLVVANLGGVQTPIELAADLRRVAAGGVLVVSGLLDDQVHAARQHLGAGAVTRCDGWAAVTVDLRPTPPASCTG